MQVCVHSLTWTLQRMQMKQNVVISVCCNHTRRATPVVLSSGVAWSNGGFVVFV